MFYFIYVYLPTNSDCVNLPNLKSRDKKPEASAFRVLYICPLTCPCLIPLVHLIIQACLHVSALVV